LVTALLKPRIPRVRLIARSGLHLGDLLEHGDVLFENLISDGYSQLTASSTSLAVRSRFGRPG